MVVLLCVSHTINCIRIFFRLLLLLIIDLVPEKIQETWEGVNVKMESDNNRGEREKKNTTKIDFFLFRECSFFLSFRCFVLFQFTGCVCLFVVVAMVYKFRSFFFIRKERRNEKNLKLWYELPQFDIGHASRYISFWGDELGKRNWKTEKNVSSYTRLKRTHGTIRKQ